MARQHNFLLGKGEKLTSKVDVPHGGGPKDPPYDFSKAKKRIGERLQKVEAKLKNTPAAACPGEEVVAVVTVHPRYISKSDFPQDLLKAAGLRSVGTRPKKIKPESWGIKKHPDEAMTEQIFVAGTKSDFNNLLNAIPQWTEKTPGAMALTQIEDLKAFEIEDKIRGIPEDREEAVFEIALHNFGRKQILSEFSSYGISLGATIFIDRARTVQGITFVPVRCKVSTVKDLAAFTFVRVARGMPTIRPYPSALTRSTTRYNVQLPTQGPITTDCRAVIFDGGLPSSVDLSPWVQYIEPTGIGAPHPKLVEHGLGVTSAFLFGPIKQGEPLRRPYCPVDHVRVVETGRPKDLEYLDVLDRILNHLDQNEGRYQFVNISMGPNFAAEDDDVNQWTSSLDERFSSENVMATVAAGNDGELDANLRLNRIQPPSDGVNVLAVGASNSQNQEWARASYSCVGPGRSPGFVKPDGVAFGGSDDSPFMILAPSANTQATPNAGTSFASPFVLSCAAGTKSLAGTELSPLAIRALLIHRANPKNHLRPEVGWGLLETDPQLLMTCDDHEAMVVYQGELALGQHLRAPIPLPTGGIKGNVLLRATLAIAPSVDPEHPGSYTKGGLEVAFRPDSRKFSKPKDGQKAPVHAKTKSFFSGSKIFDKSEFRLKEEGFKWEPCLRHEQPMRGSSLHEPLFDIWFHHREGAMAMKEPKPLPFTLVVSLSAPKEPDLYNRVVRTYAQILVPIQPKIQIPVKV